MKDFKQKFTNKTYRNIPTIKVFLICILMLTLISTVSAFDFDNRKEILKETGFAGYNDIKIGNFFGLGKTLWGGTLDYNSHTCGQHCSAIQTITLHEKGSLIDEVIFKTLQEDGSWIKQKIKNYNIQIKVGQQPYEVNDYETQCNLKLDINGSYYNYCKQVKIGSHTEYIKEWKDYNLGKELEVGTYEVRLIGEKKPSRTVDWIYKTQGETLNEWATWAGTELAYANWSSTSVSGLTLDSANWAAQSFQIGHNGNSGPFTFNKAEVYLKKAGTPGNLQARLYSADVNGKPTGSSLSTNYSITVTGLSTSLGWFNITMPGITLQNNTNYTLVLNLSTIAGDNLEWGVQTGYDFGIQMRSTDDGVTWANIGGNDQSIIIYGSAGATTLNSPADEFTTGLNEVEFNCSVSVSGANLVNMTLWHNASGTWEENVTNSISGTTNGTTFNVSFADGSYLWTCRAGANDGDSNFASENRTFRVDTTVPSITINAPTSFVGYGSLTQNETLNWTVSDTTFDSVWWEYNNTNTTLSGATGQTNFTLESGDYNGTLWANDSFNNVNFSTINWQYYLFERDSTYSTEAYETTQEQLELEINAQSGLSAISADLWYNGTTYSSTVTNPTNTIYNATNTINIPIINTDGTKNFHWEFDFTLGNGSDLSVNSSVKSQTVNRTWLTNCNATYTTHFINLSTYNANNPFPVVNGTFKIYWEWYISSSDGTIKRNDSWEDITEGNSSWAFCGSPVDKIFNVTGTIEYDGTGFAKNFYYIKNIHLSNATTNISLYLLNDSDATLTVLRVIDSAQARLENYGIEIQLYDVGTGNYYTVAMAETNFDGEDLVYLNWYDTLYKFIITDSSGTEVLNTEPYKISATPQVFEITTATTYDFDKFGDITYSLTFDNSTNIFSLTYTKPDDVDNACLRVIKRNVTNDYQICLICKTSASATMTCDVSDWTPGLFLAAFYGTGSLSLIDVYQVIVDISNEIYGELGNLEATSLAIIFAGIVMAMFFISPSLGIIGILVGMGGALLLGFQPLSEGFYPVYIGIIILGGVIIWSLNK